MTEEQANLLNAFLNGMIAMGLATAGLFFLRFWRRTGDRLFIWFASAFWLLGVIRFAMLFVEELQEENDFYWLRLIAYGMILAAIVDKNLRKT